MLELVLHVQRGTIGPRRIGASVVVQALSVAVGLVVVLSGCGSTPSRATDVERATAEAEVRQLAARVYGSPDALRAAEWLEYWTYQDSIDKCMAGHREKYRKPMLVSMLGGRTKPHIPDTFHALAELPRDDFLIPSVSRDVAAAAEQARSFAGHAYQDTPSAGYYDALTTCASTAFTPTWPEANKVLSERFFELMRRASEDPFVARESATYTECMTRELGYAVADYVSLYERVASRFSAFAVDYVDPRKTLEPAGPAWDQAVGEEAAAAAADRTCRTSAHEAALDILAPQLDAFMAENAAALNAAEQFWAGIRQRAIDRGFGEVSRAS